MDELIIRSLQGRTTVAEEEALRALRAASNENEQRYLLVSRLWSLTQTGDTITPSRPAPAVAALMRLTSQRRGVRQSSKRRWPIWLLAAAAAMVVGGGLTRFAAGGGAAEYHLDPAEYVTGRGETATVVLGDRTVVRLASASRLRVLRETNRRVVWLEGRAYFAVARHRNHPFVVRTPAGDAQVLGTQFELWAVDDSLRVVVVEGRVGLGIGADRIEIGPGEMSEVGRQGRPVMAPVADTRDLMTWLGEFLVFQATPLDQVARDLEERYEVPVRLADPDLSTSTVTAWFLDEEFTEVVTVVCRVVGARCSVAGTGATIGVAER